MSRMDQVLEWKQERAKLVKEAREILDRQEEEKRDLTAEEEERYNTIDADIDKLTARIDREEKQLERERSLGETNAKEVDGKRDGSNKEEKRTLLRDLLEGRSIEEVRDQVRETEEYRAAFANWLIEGRSALAVEEVRAMQSDVDTSGGYLVAPIQMVRDLLKEVDSQTIIRQYANVRQLRKAKSLGVVTLDQDVDDWDWTTELRTGDKTDLGFGKRELFPHPLAKRALISNTLLRLSDMGPEALLRERLSYKLAATQEKAYLLGDGNKKPLGLFVASNDGISTSRDVATGNTATQITPEGLIEAKFKLKEAYLRRARWIFHRDAIKQIRKLKDGDGQYIWQPGIVQDVPDRILGIPYSTSDFAPNTFTTGKYVGLLGDLKYYWILDSLEMQIQRLIELYAESNQTGFIGRYEGDGMPVMEEAFVRVKLA